MDTPAPNDLSAFWMPFSANRQFKGTPRLLAGAKDMHYRTPEGRKVLDGTAGLWCVNAGHGRTEIIAAIQEQASKMDYAPPFQMGHPLAFELATRLTSLAPDPLTHAFFTNSGSEAVDTALKIALAYHSRKGNSGRRRLIGRARGYHGSGFGGISVGGISPNRTNFGGLLPEVDHLGHTHSLEHNAYSRGQPKWGGHLAEELSNLITLHGPEAIAAVIVEPVAGSTGLLVPPKGYLELLRAICDAHGILLIFDEVITGFGRLGTSFAAERFAVIPDIMTLAKGLTNAAVPMGAVLLRSEIHEAFMDGPEHIIELFHGYTYSGHPLACAAGLASLELYDREELFQRAADLEDYWQDAVHRLNVLPHVIDIRNIGLAAGIELEPRGGKPGLRGYEVLVGCFESGALVRVTGDTLALSPPLIITQAQIDELLDIVAETIKKII